VLLAVLRRLASTFASLVAASVLVFAVVNILPGDVALVILGTNATPESVATLRQQLGLDQPGWLRYLAWVGGILHGDFGTSLLSHSEVAPLIAQKMAVSGPLALGAALIALALALPLGLLAGVRHRQLSGLLVSAASLGGIAVPSFWAGLLLVTLFAVEWKLLPAGGFVDWTESPAGAVRSLLLPAVALGLVQGAILLRYVRSAVIDVQREDYIRTARAKGLTRWQALRRHGLRNAAIPVVTILGIQLTSLVAGAVVVENVFVLPGLGRLLFQSVGNRDLIVVQDLVLLLTALVLAVNFLVDITYRLLDPRVRSAA
jgi:peptide/nickel transport system permease protein